MAGWGRAGSNACGCVLVHSCKDSQPVWSHPELLPQSCKLMFERCFPSSLKCDSPEYGPIRGLSPCRISWVSISRALPCGPALMLPCVGIPRRDLLPAAGTLGNAHLHMLIMSLAFLFVCYLCSAYKKASLIFIQVQVCPFSSCCDVSGQAYRKMRL